jgi:Trypsin
MFSRESGSIVANLGVVAWNGPTHVEAAVSEFTWNHHTDMAIYKLKNAVTFNANIQPVRLPTMSQAYDSFLDQLGVMAGWGGKNWRNGVLQFATVRFIRASQKYLESIPMPGKQRPAVPGDSGSSVVIYENGIATQVGVSAYIYGDVTGHTCVGQQLLWINEITGIAIRK